MKKKALLYMGCIAMFAGMLMGCGTSAETGNREPVGQISCAREGDAIVISGTGQILPYRFFWERFQ